MKLYDLTESYQSLLEQAENIDSEAFTDTLESIQDAIEEKAENTAKVIRTLEAEAKAIKEEEERLKGRRQTLEKRARGLKAYLQDHLEKANMDKVKGSLLTVAIQNNPASVYVSDESILPPRFFVTQDPKLDKKALGDWLKSGKETTGAELRQTRSLRIR